MSEKTVSLQPPTGHDEVIRHLVGLLVKDRLPHALLFSGPEGIGKCLAAYWLAARVFCLADSDQPCGQCTACLQVEARSHPDLFVVERASGKKEVGIDLIRRLKHFVRLQAVSGRHKVAIVGEAERLSISAQNGLLKTLEEPPGHALMMLVTPTNETLLPTVRSRCQRVGFRPLEDEQVAAVLQNQCGIDEGESRLLAASAEGSPGRALQLRKLMAGTEWSDLLHALADLHPSRYVSVVRLANGLGRAEEDMGTRLELLLSAHRKVAVGEFLGDRTSPTLAGQPGDINPETAVRRIEAVSEALRTLRRRNPNRPLLAEALALRLSRS